MNLSELQIVAALDEQEIIDLLENILNTLGIHDQSIDNLVREVALGLSQGIDLGMSNAEAHRNSIFSNLIGALGAQTYTLQDYIWENTNDVRSDLYGVQTRLGNMQRETEELMIDLYNDLSWGLNGTISNATNHIVRQTWAVNDTLSKALRGVEDTLTSAYNTGLNYLETKLGDLFGDFGALWSGFIDNANALMIWLLELRPLLGSIQWGSMEDFYQGYLKALRTLPTKIET